MSLFGDKKIILAFLNNFKLRFLVYEFSGNNVRQSEAEEIIFSEDIVQDGAISKPDLFQIKVSEFLKTKPHWDKLKVLLVIPEEKIFLKGFELELGDLEKREQLRRDFINEVPFLESELIIKESLSGRVLEFAAISKKSLEDLQKPFLDSKFFIAGAIAIPQVLASDLAPKAKTILMTFYDNDLVLVLSENSKVFFSETERLKPRELVKNIFNSLTHFKGHPLAKEVNSLMLVLDPVLPETILVQRMEDQKYSIASVKKVNFFDVIADYYQKNVNSRKNWDFLFMGRSGLMNLVTPENKQFWLLGVLVFLFIGLLGGGIFWYQKIFLPNLLGENIVVEVPVAEEPAEEVKESLSEINTASEKPKLVEQLPVKKENFLIKIFNGTKVAGEATRLKAVLQGKGFVVNSVGNNEDQNQTVTTIFAQNSAPDALVSELRSVLEVSYQTVLVSPSPVTENGVIHIVIGKKK